MVFKLPSLIIALCIFTVFAPLMLIFYFKSGAEHRWNFSSLRNVGLMPKFWDIVYVISLWFLDCSSLHFYLSDLPDANSDRRSVVSTEGVAIQMVIDRSSSMRQPMDFENERSTRFEVVRQVFTDFVLGNGTRKLPADQMTFSLNLIRIFPWGELSVNPWHQNLVEFMKNIRPVTEIRNWREEFYRQRCLTMERIGDAIYMQCFPW